MMDSFGFGPIPPGYHRADDVAAASAARKKRYEAAVAEKKARAEQIAEAKKADAKAREARLNANPFTFDPTPLKDDNGNVDSEGLMIDAVMHSLMLEPHRTLSPDAYYEAQRARFQEQRQEAISQIRESAEEKREQRKDDDLDALQRRMMGQEMNWDEIEDDAE
jgi:hypothetical protein